VGKDTKAERTLWEKALQPVGKSAGQKGNESVAGYLTVLRNSEGELAK